MGTLEKLKPLALLLLRCALGIIFISHGLPKLQHMSNTVQFMSRLGFPSYFAYIAGVLEVFGGCLLIVGLFTRVIGLLLAGEIVIALFKVRLPQGSIYAVKNYELEMVLAAAAFALVALGAGSISLDQPIFGKARAKPARIKS